jgi:hypothetical protein
MWEVGFAMALGKPVLLITQNITELPFDLKDMRAIEYRRAMLDDFLFPPLTEALRQTVTSVKTRTEARRLPSEHMPGLTIVVTGSMGAEEGKTRRRIDSHICQRKRIG